MSHIYKFILMSILLSTTAYAQGSRQDAVPLIPDNWRGIYEEYGFSPALKVGDTIYVSGMIVRLQGEGTYQEQYANGIRAIFSLLEKLLAEEGATLDDIVEMTSFHTDLPRQMQTILAVRKELMNEPHPAWTAVGTTALAVPEGQTEIKFTVKLRQ